MYRPLFEDPESAWRKIEQDAENLPSKFREKRKAEKRLEKVIDNLTPMERKLYDMELKYNELNNKYANEYGRNTGTQDCERLLENLRAFERVFSVMGWNINKSFL